MGYNKEQQLKAQNNKFRKEISLKIIGELRELTGEAFDDLEQLLKREIPEEIQNNQFEIHSKTTLYPTFRTLSLRIGIYQNISVTKQL